MPSLKTQVDGLESVADEVDGEGVDGQMCDHRAAGFRHSITEKRVNRRCFADVSPYLKGSGVVPGWDRHRGNCDVAAVAVQGQTVVRVSCQGARGLELNVADSGGVMRLTADVAQCRRTRIAEPPITRRVVPHDLVRISVAWLRAAAELTPVVDLKVIVLHGVSVSCVRESSGT